MMNEMNEEFLSKLEAALAAVKELEDALIAQYQESDFFGDPELAGLVSLAISNVRQGKFGLTRSRQWIEVMGE